ncbi:hypothetical protein D6745_04370 [Candidatus Woesearchaeota archaeon]|nr:MAG: hypothetical protein D6745_04370 [Candidatus Woesearchaeota archaeon]
MTPKRRKEDGIVPSGGAVPFGEQDPEEPVVVKPDSKPTKPASETTVYTTEDFTLKDRLLDFLTIKGSPYFKIRTPLEKTILRELGVYALKFEPKLTSTHTGTTIHFLIRPDTPIPSPLLRHVFESSQHYDFDYLCTTDIADFLNLQDESQVFDLTQNTLTSLFPEFSMFTKINNKTIPGVDDPYLFLMMTRPELRPFLSECLDEMGYKRKSVAQLDELMQKHTHKYDPLVSTSVILKVGERLGITRIKQYIDGVIEIRDTLRGLK